MDIELEIVHAKSNKPLVTLLDILDTFTVRELKNSIAGKKPKYKDINRQELRLEPKGKPLKDDQTLAELGLKNGAIVYFKVRSDSLDSVLDDLLLAGPRPADRLDHGVPQRVRGADVRLSLVLHPTLAGIRGLGRRHPGPLHHPSCPIQPKSTPTPPLPTPVR